MSLAWNVTSPQAVDTAIEHAINLGGTLLRPPQTVFWGGYNGYFADFDGHIDFDLRDDIRKLQLSYGMIPDGHPSRAFLDRLGLLVP